MSTSARLEREAEETRAEIAATIDELRARMTPGHVVDQLVNYANESSGGAFFRNLRQQVVENPAPVVLMGAGLAWLALSSRGNGVNGSGRASNLAAQANERSASAARDAADNAWATADEWSRRTRSGASATGDRARETAEDFQESVRSGYRSAAGAASSAYDSTVEGMSEAAARVQDAAQAASDGASDTYDAAAEQVRRTGRQIKHSAADMRDNVAAGSRSVMHLLSEHPLVLAGLGLALGAAIGAALPSTDTEDELMGKESDKLKDQVEGFAQTQAAKGEAVAEKAWDAANVEAESQGLTSKSDTVSSEASSEAAEGAQSSQHDGASEEATIVPSLDGAERGKLERSGP